MFGRAFWNEELPLDQQEIDEIPEYFGVKAVLAIDLGVGENELCSPSHPLSGVISERIR